MRVFFAVTLPESVRNRLTDLSDKLAAEGVTGRWTRPDNLHLTLVFLGEAEETLVARLASIEPMIASFPCFRLTIDHLGSFDSGRRAIVWCGISENSTLATLQSALEAELMRSYGLSDALRPYRPHVTLARESGNLPEGWIPFPPLAVEVRDICLMHSTRRDGLLTYVPLRRFSLAES